jgi:D-alanine-D-alanine ligase-like ATP-grasp enzyme
VKRIRVGVIFGGRSSEHDVSVRSASSVLASLNPDRYSPAAVYIDPEGHWILPSRLPEASTDAEAREYVKDQARSFRHDSEVVMPARPGDETLLVFSRAADRSGDKPDHGSETSLVKHLHLDVVIPSCTAPTARMAPSRACSNSPTFRTSARASSPPPWAWTRR